MSGEEIFKTVFMFFFCGGGVVFAVVLFVAARAHIRKMVEAARLAQQAEAEESPKKQKKKKVRRRVAGEEELPGVLPVSGSGLAGEERGSVAEGTFSPGTALAHLSGAQRIFAMAEIMGPPLALRGTGESLGPSGL